MLKKIFSHTAIYGLAPYVPQVANIFILPIITQDLTDLDFGVIGIITAYSGLISVFSTLGLKVVLVNIFYKNRNRYKIFWRQIYGFLNLWVIIYSTLFAGLIYVIVPKEAIENRVLIVLLNVIPIFFFGPTRHLCSTLYQIKERPLPIGIRTTIFGFISVLLNLYTISYLKMGYMGWIWSGFIVNIATQASYWYPLTQIEKIKPLYFFKWRFIKQSLRVSLPTVPHYYSGYLLNNSDRIVMDIVGVGMGNIGKYNVAYKFGNYVQSLGMAFNKAIGPILMAKYKEKDEEKARDVVFIVQILFLFGTFIISIWLKEIFELLIKNKTLASMYPLGIIIIMGYNYRPMYIGASQKLFYTEKTNLLWKITFIAGVSNVILNFIAIPIWGYEAAAYTTFITLMYMGYAGYFTQTFKEVNSASYNPIYWLSGTIIMTALAYTLRDQSLLGKVFFTTGIVITLFFLIRQADLNELKND